MKKPIKKEVGVYRYNYSRAGKDEENWTVDILAFDHNDAVDQLCKKVGPIKIHEQGKTTGLHLITDGVLEMINHNYNLAHSDPIMAHPSPTDPVHEAKVDKRFGPRPKKEELNENKGDQ